MKHDEIIEQVRAIRDQLAARQGYDVRALYEEAKRREQEGERTVVRLKPRLLEKVEKKSV